MHLRALKLEEFRSYRRLALPLDPRGLRLYGANASGKSTLLEAMALLATTRSPRTSSDRELINWESGVDLGFPPFARARGEVVVRDAVTVVEVGLQADAEGSNRVRKQLRLGGRTVRAMDAVGTLKAVLFAPEDVGLVAGAPAGRRRYLDLTISQVDGGYLRALARYARLIEQRNSLLRGLARDRVRPDSPSVASQLAFWDEELVAFGSALVARRAQMVARLAALAAGRFRALDAGELAVAYVPSLGAVARPPSAECEDGPRLQARIAQEFAERLVAARADEVRRGVTVVGPHRDDVSFAVAGVDLGTYGSRGQQRLAVVALKLAEADLMTEAAGEPPVLLLDDVLSELDPLRGATLVDAVARIGAQVVVTATDRGLLDRPELSDLPIARVEQGSVEVETAS